MKTSFCLLAVYFTLHAAAQHFVPDKSHSGIAFWQPDILGNHRAVVHVNQKQDAVF